MDTLQAIKERRAIKHYDAEKVAKIINLPDDHIAGMLLVVGKGTKSAWPKPGQLALSDVVIENKF